MEPQKPAAYCSRGLILLEQGKDAEAQKDFDQCLRLGPTYKVSLDQEIQKANQRRQRKR